MLYLPVSGADPDYVSKAEQILSCVSLSWVMNQGQQVRIICEVINTFSRSALLCFSTDPDQKIINWSGCEGLR